MNHDITAPPSRFRRLLRWLPVVVLLAAAAFVGVGLARGGMSRVATWYLMQILLPVLGALFLIFTLPYALWRRRFSLPMLVTTLLSLLALWPLLWLLQIAPIAYPASIESSRPAATVRLPANGPLKVGWGGDSVATNRHAAVPDQRWAYDLAVEPFGIGSERLGDYGCYGVEVVAPVAGPVVIAHDGEPDIPPGALPAAVTQPLGNHVVIEHQGAYLLIAHLREGSVAVQAGQTVAEGERLGECGNSGNTSEPHIHIHYQRQNPAEFPLNFAEGLPLFFRDHDGAPMPLGGIHLEEGTPVATGDVVQHVGE